MEREVTRVKLVQALHTSGLIGGRLAQQVDEELAPAAKQVAEWAGLELTEEVMDLFEELVQLAVQDEPVRKKIRASPGAPYGAAIEDAILMAAKVMVRELPERARPPKGRRAYNGTRLARRCRA